LINGSEKKYQVHMCPQEYYGSEKGNAKKLAVKIRRERLNGTTTRSTTLTLD